MIDQTENKSLLKGLEQFGLSTKEAQVYLVLLPRRDVGSSKIITATGLHKQFVYNALTRLEELGLAKHVIQKNRKKFSANTPTRIISLLEEKRIAAQTMVRQLQERFIGAHDLVLFTEETDQSPAGDRGQFPEYIQEDQVAGHH